MSNDWKYLICAVDHPEWGEFKFQHAVYKTEPLAAHVRAARQLPGDSDPTRIAEMIAEDQALKGNVLLCMEDPHGNRFEVTVHEELVSKYDATDCKELGKS